MAKKHHKKGKSNYGESGSSGAEGKTHANHAHTGDIRHSDMVMHKGSNGLGGKDPHAHSSHHEANKAFGMHEGMSPKDDGSGEQEHGGEGMEGNCEYCE
jgi:hypothetical protein